jgi:hypothetical protein
VCAESVSQRSVRRRLTSILRVGAVEPEEGRKVVAVRVPRATSEWTREAGRARHQQTIRDTCPGGATLTAAGKCFPSDCRGGNGGKRLRPESERLQESAQAACRSRKESRSSDRISALSVFPSTTHLALSESVGTHSGFHQQSWQTGNWSLTDNFKIARRLGRYREIRRWSVAKKVTSTCRRADNRLKIEPP